MSGKQYDDNSHFTDLSEPWVFTEPVPGMQELIAKLLVEPVNAIKQCTTKIMKMKWPFMFTKMKASSYPEIELASVKFQIAKDTIYIFLGV